jgi:hypothetical protein
VKPDAAAMEKFTAFAKSKGMSQEDAQALVTMGAEMQLGSAQQLQAAVEAQGDKWATDAKADAEIGGDKFEENLAMCKGAMEKFATPDFVKFLNESKLGNHPEMLRTFYRIGQAISQDSFVPGRSGAPKGDARSMYAKSNMNP